MIHVTHSIRLPEELLRRIKARSVVNQRSVNQEMLYLIRKALEDTDHADDEIVRVLKTRMIRSDI